MRTISRILCIAALVTALCVPARAQEWGVSNYTRSVTHFTTKNTTTLTTGNVTLYSLIITCTNAGTSWTMSVQDKAGTAHVVYAGTLSVGTTVIALPVGIRMTGGIDLVSGGTTAGVADVWCVYR